MKGLELRELRKKKGYSRNDFANLVGISVHTLDSWEGGKRNIPKLKEELILIKIRDQDETSDLEKNMNISDLFVNEPSEIFKTKAGSVYTENSDGTYTITVPMVPFEAYASYVNMYQDEIAIVNEWEKVSFNVDRVGKGKYMGFRSKGDSMNGGGINDTPNDALILGRELGRHHWIDGFKPNQYGWIIVSTYSIMHKDIVGMNKEEGTITCHSRNKSPEHQDFQLELNDVFQIFKVIKRTF